MASEDGRVVGVHRNTGERNGKRLDVLCCIVFDIKNGKMIDLGLASRVISGGTRDCPGVRPGWVSSGALLARWDETNDRFPP
ncbi:hypothetical protein [Mesorhizobium sp.]|uniref:hypothetical protein n=1 Tax=Mesorhizobium sp. TaxID=1871066 RepID=UPI002580BC6F|nr:hypothetical protein [Mesorhizobium sp.]